MTFFCLYTDPDSVQPFVGWLNGIHPAIKFTSESSELCVNFVDSRVFITEQQTLAVKPFVKPTDKNSYLHFASYHPRHLRMNIPYG